jgi:hypothetical protein
MLSTFIIHLAPFNLTLSSFKVNSRLSNGHKYPDHVRKFEGKELNEGS